MAGQLLAGLATSAFAFAFPLAGLDKALFGPAGAGLGFAAFFLARLAASPLAGSLCDRVGARLPLVLGCAAPALAALAALAAPGEAALALVQAVLGLSSGVVRPAAMAAMASVAARLEQTSGLGSPNRSGKRLAWAAGVQQAALAAGPLLGGLCYAAGRLESVLIAATLLLALAAGLFAWAVPAGGATRGPRADAAPRETSRADSSIFPLLLCLGGRGLGIGALAAFLPLLLARSLPRDALLFGALCAAPSLASLAGLPLGGRLADRPAGTSRALAAALGMAASALALTGFGLAAAPLSFALLALASGLGTSVSLPASMALAAGHAASGAHGAGRALGLAHAAVGAGLVAGPLAGTLAVRAGCELTDIPLLCGAAGLAASLPLLASALAPRLSPALRVGITGLAAAAILLGATALPRAPSGLVPRSAALPDAAPETDTRLWRFQDVAMGTLVHLTLEAASEKAARDAAERAMELMRRLEADFSHRVPTGSVGRINAAAGRAPVRVDAEAFALVERALRFGEATAGAFDITVGAVTTTPFWFARDLAEAAAKSPLVDYRLVRLDKAARTVFLPRRGMALDLGGLAKGAIVDAAVAELRARGVAAGIVEAGGDFHAFGDRAWSAGIRHPRHDEPIGRIEVAERGVCGSGDYEQYVDGPHGERRHHILDTRAPEGPAPARASIGVTVVADSAETADALATALFVLGPERGSRVLAEGFPDARALWVLPDGSLRASPDFPLLPEQGTDGAKRA